VFIFMYISQLVFQYVQHLTLWFGAHDVGSGPLGPWITGATAKEGHTLSSPPARGSFPERNVSLSSRAAIRN